jgi:hypothetical protein
MCKVDCRIRKHYLEYSCVYTKFWKRRDIVLTALNFRVSYVRWCEITLRLTVSQSVCLGIEYPCGTCDQILLPVGMLLSEIWGLVSVGRPLWREDGRATYSVITQWSESRKTRNHTLLSHLRLPETGGSGSRIYVPQEQGGPVIPRALGSLYVVSYDSQGYSRGILTLSVHILQEQDGPDQSQSQKLKVKVTLRPMASQSVCLGVS